MQNRPARFGNSNAIESRICLYILCEKKIAISQEILFPLSFAMDK